MEVFVQYRIGNQSVYRVTIVGVSKRLDDAILLRRNHGVYVVFIGKQSYRLFASFFLLRSLCSFLVLFVHRRLFGTVERIAYGDPIKSLGSEAHVVFGKLKREVATVQFFGDRDRRRTAGEGIDHDIVFRGTGANDAAQQLFGHLATVESGPLFERSSDAREMPSVLVGFETIDQLLRTEDPSIVRHSTNRVGAGIVVDQLPR